MNKISQPSVTMRDPAREPSTDGDGLRSISELISPDETASLRGPGNVGQILKRLRLRHGLSLREVADAVEPSAHSWDWAAPVSLFSHSSEIASYLHMRLSQTARFGMSRSWVTTARAGQLTW
jgi:hypothetical protein